MKNLYKIDDELYIISNTENVDENCWIITDGKLVQVSYLLSDELAKGNKVILTTNKFLINDGVQAINDEFLEWFVKNPSCEEVKIESWQTKGEWDLDYKIIIPQEEPKQETLEEFIKSQPYYGTCTTEYKEGIEDGAKWQAKRMYSEEEVRLILDKTLIEYSDIVLADIPEWFEQNKKK
jgi:hypothetical protein